MFYIMIVQVDDSRKTPMTGTWLYTVIQHSTVVVVQFNYWQASPVLKNMSNTIDSSPSALINWILSARYCNRYYNYMTITIIELYHSTTVDNTLSGCFIIEKIKEHDRSPSVLLSIKCTRYQICLSSLCTQFGRHGKGPKRKTLFPWWLQV